MVAQGERGGESKRALSGLVTDGSEVSPEQSTGFIRQLKSLVMHK